MSQVKYKRILLKLGGESLADERMFGIDPEGVANLASRIASVRKLGVQIAIVLGSGNIWRGQDGTALGMDRSAADHMGMLATVMNALALADALNQLGCTTRVQTAITMQPVAEPYIRLRAIRHLDKGRVVILGAGTGNPYFTTDTAAALRAMEIHAEVLIKITKVDGIYNVDPAIHSEASKFDHLDYIDALNLRVGVMDSTAITLCMDNNLPIIVAGLATPNVLDRIVVGDKVGTLVGVESASAEKHTL